MSSRATILWEAPNLVIVRVDHRATDSRHRSVERAARRAFNASRYRDDRMPAVLRYMLTRNASGDAVSLAAFASDLAIARSATEGAWATRARASLPPAPSVAAPGAGA